MTQLRPPGDLHRRPLGTTGLLVTPICIGCTPHGGNARGYGGRVDEAQSLAFLRAALDGPLNYLDTASQYGDGESERRIGLALRECGGLPPGFVLQTKAGRDPRTGEFSGDRMRWCVERSLRLLGLDRIQMLYLHDPQHTTFESAIAPGGPVEALRRLKDEGVVEHLGVAGGDVEPALRLIETGLFEVVITANRYNLLTRETEPVVEAGHRAGMAVLSAAPYGAGILLTGAVPGAIFMYREAPPFLLERTARIEALCRRHGVRLPAAALQFATRDPRITATIVGMSTTAMLEETIELATAPIPDAFWAELEPLLPPPEERVTAMLGR